MRRALLYLFPVLVISFSGCRHPDLVDTHSGGGQVRFFQLADTCLINKAIVQYRRPSRNSEYLYSLNGGDGWVELYPKNIEGQPVFGEQEDGTDFSLDWKVGEFYTIEDLISSPKYIELQDGYYTLWPFVCLSGCYVNVDWEDVLTVDLDTVERITKPYAVCYLIHEKELVKLTHKSTKHFRGVHSQQMTMNDVVRVLNEIIENGTIDEHCFKYYPDYVYE